MNNTDHNGYFEFIVNPNAKDLIDDKLLDAFYTAQDNAISKISNFLGNCNSYIDPETRNAFTSILGKLKGKITFNLNVDLKPNVNAYYNAFFGTFYYNAQRLNDLQCSYTNHNNINIESFNTMVLAAIIDIIAPILINEAMHKYQVEERPFNDGFAEEASRLRRFYINLIYNFFAGKVLDIETLGKHDFEEEGYIPPDGQYFFDEIFTGEGAERFYKGFIQ